MIRIEMPQTAPKEKKIPQLSKPTDVGDGKFSGMLNEKCTVYDRMGENRLSDREDSRQEIPGHIGGLRKSKAMRGQFQSADLTAFLQMELNPFLQMELNPFLQMESNPFLPEGCVEEADIMETPSIVAKDLSGMEAAMVVGMNEDIPRNVDKGKLDGIFGTDIGLKAMMPENKLMEQAEPADVQAHVLREKGVTPSVSNPNPKMESETGESRSEEKNTARTSQTQDHAMADIMTMASAREGNKEPVRMWQPVETVRTTPALLPTDVGKAIALRLPQKSGELQIELEPESLGKIVVRVTYEEGRASIALMSSNPKTLEILCRNAGDIAGILEEKTGRETVIYTLPPETSPDNYQKDQGADHRGQEQKKNEKKQQSDIFLQQFRLGLV